MNKGRTSFIMSEDRRTQNNGLKLNKKSRKKVLLVILKVLKMEVNCFESLADKCTARLAVDSQGHHLKVLKPTVKLAS